MRKFLILGAAFIAMAVGSIAYAEPSSVGQSNGTLYAYNNEQIVNGATIQGGRWVLVKLRIQNGQVFNFSFGARDMVGNIQWSSCYPTSYRKTQPGLDGNDICREYNYTATLSGQGFSSFKVYF